MPLAPVVRPLLLTLIGGAALLISPLAVRAHGIETNLEQFAGLASSVNGSKASNSGRFRLQSHFSSGVPASSAAVRLVPPDGGASIEIGRTDSEGQLSFALPAEARADWEIQVDAGPGHRDYLELPAGVGSSDGGHAMGHAPAPLGPVAAWRRTWRMLAPEGLASAGPALMGLGMVGGLGGLLWRRRRA